MSAPETTEVNWLTDEEQRVWRGFLLLSRSMQTAIDRQLARDSALSGSEYEVLVLLSESSTGVARSRDLLNQLGWERSRLSHLLSRMAKRGLLERLPCDSDARGLDVRITPEGRGAIENAAPAHLAMVRAALIDHLTPEEMDAILSVSAKVAPRLKELGLC
ncbi:MULTISPECIES: MarR family winged helix-turn-helix transcriptional regulator [Kocuria]|jgi:DNA-binding MarR family transcriptional regulator|uniref:MarR family winged helix-turn-helix transcriptional regulator n=1 Tax=Kocuria TaxID=57493 RepID=UPI0020417E7A|nr:MULTISPECIES: MarR family transcriptional regulator [Kocuria]MCM3686448.1 MarR family transcriptional regulator [Kocuria rosea]HST72308.1 MarR family transcriptional regulator [Kocuria rosea]